MRVITPGEDQKPWTAEIICNGRGWGEKGCGAKLEIDALDIHRHYGGGGTGYGRNETSNYVECSWCDKKNDVDVPQKVLDNIRERMR